MKTYQIQFSQNYFFNVNAKNKEEAKSKAEEQMGEWIDNEGSYVEPEIDKCIKIPFIEEPDFVAETPVVQAE
jgi:hypothetical protein